MYVALSGDNLLISVVSQEYNCLMELYTNFGQNFTFHDNVYLPSSFIFRYHRAEMNVHAFMNELDLKDYWYPRKNKKNCENLCTKSMESCPLVIWHILASIMRKGRHFLITNANSSIDCKLHKRCARFEWIAFCPGYTQCKPYIIMRGLKST